MTVNIKPLIYTLAIILLICGIGSRWVWEWYWYNTAKLAMRRL